MNEESFGFLNLEWHVTTKKAPGGRELAEYNVREQANTIKRDFFQLVRLNYEKK